MKKLILIFICSLFITHYTKAQDYDIRVTGYSFHNWIIGWGIDYSVKLKNNGDITGKNLRLIFIDEISNETFSYTDTTFADWGESLIPTKEVKKTFNRTLPNGFKVLNSTVTVFRKQ
ncbi:MAG: hypothetical protein L0Y79_05545 [Chlorobi bacterium]|nr:hypothetical protein [Chlorobiota bacterium]MCI0716488.1 hypothetical protein [Chlorobiota bacterium]